MKRKISLFATAILFAVSTVYFVSCKDNEVNKAVDCISLINELAEAEDEVSEYGLMYIKDSSAVNCKAFKESCKEYLAKIKKMTDKCEYSYEDWENDIKEIQAEIDALNCD